MPAASSPCEGCRRLEPAAARHAGGGGPQLSFVIAVGCRRAARVTTAQPYPLGCHALSRNLLGPLLAPAGARWITCGRRKLAVQVLQHEGRVLGEGGGLLRRGAAAAAGGAAVGAVGACSGGAWGGLQAVGSAAREARRHPGLAQGGATSTRRRSNAGECPCLPQHACTY